MFRFWYQKKCDKIKRKNILSVKRVANLLYAMLIFMQGLRFVRHIVLYACIEHTMIYHVHTNMYIECS
jgi:hypothetical protein